MRSHTRLSRARRAYATVLPRARVHVHHPGLLLLEAHRSAPKTERERRVGVLVVEQQRHGHSARTTTTTTKIKKSRIAPSRSAACRGRVLPVSATRVYLFARASIYTIPGQFPFKHTAQVQKSSEHGPMACEKSSSSATHARRKKSRIAASRSAACRGRVLPVVATRVYLFARASMYTILGQFPSKHAAQLQKLSEHGPMAC